MDCTIFVAKTKALITAKLICVFVFTYAKKRFSHNEAQMSADEIFMLTQQINSTDFQRHRYKVKEL